MDFKLTRSQKEIQKAAREFAKGEFDKNLAYELDRTKEFPRKIWEHAAELGFIGIHYPEAYSGGGMGSIENALVAEEFCRSDSTIGSALMLAGIGSESLRRFGSSDLKEKYLTKIVEGRMISGFAFIGSNTDTFPQNTTSSGGEDWIVSGHTARVINGGLADIYFVLCRTGMQNNEPNNFSMLLIEDQKAGDLSAEAHEGLGLRMTPFADIHFKGVYVPYANLVGKEKDGMRQTDIYLNEARVLISAMALGIAEGAFDRALSYVKQREQFGRKIIHYQVTQHKLAEMATMIEKARLLTFHAAWALDNQRKAEPRLTAMAKMTATRTAVAVAGEAIQLLGGYGYMTEYEVERFLRDAKVLALILGNSNCMSDIIADNALGRIKS